ncbi:MAG: PQQ-like beta-propeller repeat protein, partial [Planctomycetia bacterium]|nr:PQQ-like beta-propeller repeat protein [Planctomycetia bacterium]
MHELMRVTGMRVPIVIGAMAAVVCASWILADENARRPPDHRPNRGVRRSDWPQLGGSTHRNNAPQGPRVPIDWDVATGRNIKWSAPLGSQTYGNVVVANGQIYVGTNNAGGRLPRYPAKVDLGVLLCLRESDGSLLWQYSSEKLASGRVHDWEMLGLC